METSDNLIGTKITKEQWKGKVAKWHKSTTTSLSGRHLGHFKALIHWFAESPDTEEGREMFRKREDIFNARLIWKELVEEAEKRGTINQELHGGCQGHDAKTLSLIEELKYDISYSS
eukprot:6514191-Ditylum_brightwellii.AAC.1